MSTARQFDEWAAEWRHWSELERQAIEHQNWEQLACCHAGKARLCELPVDWQESPAEAIEVRRLIEQQQENQAALHRVRTQLEGQRDQVFSQLRTLQQVGRSYSFRRHGVWDAYS
jgi:hypothetical protein